MLRLGSKQLGFVSLFILILLIVVITAAVTFGIPKILRNQSQTANISEQIQQKEKELEELRAVVASQSQENLAQELLALKKELEALKSNSPKPSATKQITPKPTSTPIITAPEEGLKIVLSASRYSLPANGEAISFITAEIRNKNNGLVESFSGEIEFNTSAGVLIPNKVVAKNGTSYTELQASTVPTNLTITAQSGNIKSNSINLSFSTPSTPAPVAEFNIEDNDIQAVVALICPPGNPGWGSGVIFSSDGRIITNQHVVDGATICDVYASNNMGDAARLKYKAYVISQSANPDAAILKIYTDADNKPLSEYNFNYLNLGNSSGLKIGTEIMALGYPLLKIGSSYDPSNTITLTKGVISGLTSDYVKTDIQFSGGNSGGPIINTDKQVIGIATLIIDGDRGQLRGFIEINKIAQWAKSKNIYWPN